jgi:hypothetical protein
MREPVCTGGTGSRARPASPAESTGPAWEASARLVQSLPALRGTVFVNKCEAACEQDFPSSRASAAADPAASRAGGHPSTCSDPEFGLSQFDACPVMWTPRAPAERHNSSWSSGRPPAQGGTCGSHSRAAIPRTTDGLQVLRSTSGVDTCRNGRRCATLNASLSDPADESGAAFGMAGAHGIWRSRHSARRQLSLNKLPGGYHTAAGEGQSPERNHR